MSRLLPTDINTKYQVVESHHAAAILKLEYESEYLEIIESLRGFSFSKSDILSPGGGKSIFSNYFDSFFYNKGWIEKKFEIVKTIDGRELEIPTHKIDCYRNKIGLEIEWNNKDTFYDRDLNNFRLLFDLGAISCGIMITRSTELQTLFKQLVNSDGLSAHKYVSSTTHLNKLLPKIHSGAAGGCPLLVFGIGLESYTS